MSRPTFTAALCCLLGLVAAGCGSTGGGVVSFNARAGGPSNSAAAREFDTGVDASSYHIVLSQACFHLGAVYLNMSQPISGSQAEPCAITDGTYIGQVFGNTFAGDGDCGGDIDLLSSNLIPFPQQGTGTANHAVYTEVWLSSGEIYAPTDNVPILRVAGNASRGQQTWPFSATVTIGANRTPLTELPGAPGANPICAQRIVTPIFVDFTLSDGGTLDVRIDPSGMFTNVDFAQLTPDPNGALEIPDDSNNSVVGKAFFSQVKSSRVYQFTWTNK